MSEVPLTADTQRIKLRRALKQAREAAHLQPGQVAKALDWSPSKIIRIEQGAVGVATVDLQALLRLYGVHDTAEAAELEHLARNSRRLVYSAYRKVHSETALSLFAVEQDAERITKYSPTFVPGVMQTADYASALLTGLGGDKDEVEAKVELRLQRQEVYESDRHPTFHVVIAEAALALLVGGPDVMARQYQRILEFSRLRDVTVQVILAERGPHPRLGGAFTVLEFADETLTTLLFLENSAGDSLVRDDADSVSDFLAAFEVMTEMAEPAEVLERVLSDLAHQRLGLDMSASG